MLSEIFSHGGELFGKYSGNVTLQILWMDLASRESFFELLICLDFHFSSILRIPLQLDSSVASEYQYTEVFQDWIPFYDARWAEGAPDLLLHYFGLVVNEYVVFWLALGHFGGYHPVEFWVFVVASCGRVRDPVESHENRRMQAKRFTPVEPLTCFACEYVGFPLVYPSTRHVQSYLEYVRCLHARVEDRGCIRIL